DEETKVEETVPTEETTTEAPVEADSGTEEELEVAE
ncbi:unnamed protein product, partial [marine sediment metagenome]